MPPARFALLLILLLGAGLRLYNLGAPSLWWDEANTMNFSRWVDEPDKWFDTTYINESPLILVVAHVWDAAITQTTGLPLTHPLRDFLLRLVPWFFGVAAIPLLYLLTLRLTASSVAALCAALFFALSPFQIHYAQELRVYSLHVFTGLAAAYCMLRALDEDRPRWWMGMVLCNALLFYGHYVSVWIIFCFNLYFLLQLPTKRHLLWKWTGWNALMMLLITPALYHAWLCNQHLLLVEYAWYPTPTLRSLYITFKNFYFGYGPGAMAYQPLLLGMFLLCALGSWQLRKRPLALALLVLLVLGPVLLNWIMWRMRDFSMYEDRLFVLSAALSYPLIGAGILLLKKPLLQTMTVLALVALTVPGLHAYYRGALHPLPEHRLAICDKVDFRSAASYLDTVWEDGDFLAHDSNFTVFPMRHYLQRPQAHLGATPEDAIIYGKAFGNPGVLEHLGALPVLASEAVQGRKRIWFIEAFGVTADDQPQTQAIGEWLRERYPVIEEHLFDGLRLYLFDATVASTAAMESPDA